MRRVFLLAAIAVLATACGKEGRDRMEALGGSIDVSSAVGEGTLIVASFRR